MPDRSPPVRRRRQHRRRTARHSRSWAERPSSSWRARRPSGRRRSRARSGSPSPSIAPRSTRPSRRTVGAVVTVTDDAILAAWRELAGSEGVFCEPSSAAGLAALRGSLRPEAGPRSCASSPAMGSRIPRRPPSARARRRSHVDPDPDAIARGHAVSRGGPGPGAGHDREPRPGVRLRRRRARPLERARCLGGRGHHGRRARKAPTSSAGVDSSRSSRLRLLAPAGRASASRFVNRIPLARGPRLERGHDRPRAGRGFAWLRPQAARSRRCWRSALELEGHADNLAPALAGGVCLTWRPTTGASGSPGSPRRPPLVPDRSRAAERVETAAARAALPEEIAHADARFTVSRAALLGAALASGCPRAACRRVRRPPARALPRPALARLRADPGRAAGGRGRARRSPGSGPTVIVWAREPDAAHCADELAARFPDCNVLRLAVVPNGAGPFQPTL